MLRKTKRWISLGITVVMLASLLAGCGQRDNTDKTDKTPSNQSETDKKTEENKTADDSSRPTFKVATVRWTDSWPTDFLESGVMKELEDKHNINIDWQVYYYADWVEQKSLLLASGDLPDAFLGSISLQSADIAQNKSYFIELTDLINENMPNLTAAFEKAPELRAIATGRDGKIYSLPKKLPKRPVVCGNVGYINKKWLDNLGLAMPKTYKELADVLVKFAQEDADGDGDSTNEIPFTGAAGATVLSNDLRNILSPFGTMVSRSNDYMGLNGEGKPVFMPVQENYKEAVKWMHELYAAGAVDPEYFTQEGSMAMAKRQAEGGSKVGFLFGWTADAEAGINSSEFALLEAVEGPDGNHYVENAMTALDIADRELVITTKCSDPAKLLQWADDFYTDLVALQTFYGSIPDYITDNGGTYHVEKPSDGSSLDTSAWSNSLRDFGPKFMNPEFYDKITLPEDQGDGIKLSEDAVNAKYVTTDKNVGFPVVQYTEEELAKLAQLGTDIYKYCEAQYAHWVVDGGIEEEWDAYLQQLNNMGLQELIGIQENAFNFYKEAMKAQ